MTACFIFLHPKQASVNLGHFGCNQASHGGFMQNLDRNHLVCELLQKDKHLSRYVALCIADKIMRKRYRKGRKKPADAWKAEPDPINPRTPMWFGKHKGTPIQEISGEYWGWFLENKPKLKYKGNPRVTELRDFLTKYIYLREISP